MGRGTPCPMPPLNRDAIHERLLQLRDNHDLSIYEKAKLLQDLWPGCTGNHVRGAIAGLKSKELGGRGPNKRKPFRVPPWRPGQPKPERNA